MARSQPNFSFPVGEGKRTGVATVFDRDREPGLAPMATKMATTEIDDLASGRRPMILGGAEGVLVQLTVPFPRDASAERELVSVQGRAGGC